MKTILDKHDPLLRQVVSPVPNSEFGSNWLKELIQDMFLVIQELTTKSELQNKV